LAAALPLLSAYPVMTISVPMPTYAAAAMRSARCAGVSSVEDFGAK
jgi:hypothetical protein